MTLPFSIPEFVYYAGMTFGEMVDAGFEWSAGWESGVYSLTPQALAFWGPLALQRVDEECYSLVPGVDRPGEFRRNLRREFVKAFNHYGPILQTLFLGDTMQDGGDPASGVINIQSDGQTGYRQSELNSEYPQSMLQKNIQDYASSGKSVSYGTESNVGNLDAIMQAIGIDGKPTYQDALNLMIDEFSRSGCFSSFIY